MHFLSVGNAGNGVCDNLTRILLAGFSPAARQSRVVTGFGFLDRPMPRALVIVLLAACALVPLGYFARQIAERPDLTGVIYFGDNFAAREVPALQTLHPQTQPSCGYDGQFYAQIALDPTMPVSLYRTALDGTAWRGQRIFLPVVAWLAGLGQPRVILIVYALLNLLAWGTLLMMMRRRLQPFDARRMLGLYAVMLSTGTLVSLQYALTDLPAVALGLLAIDATEMPAALLVTCAALTKPTGLLFAAGPFLPASLRPHKIALALIPTAALGLWTLYIYHHFSVPRMSSDLGWPGVAFVHHLLDILTRTQVRIWNWNNGAWIFWDNRFLELLALFSSAVQVLFLAARPRWRDPLWRVGAAFAVLFVFLSDAVCLDTIDYSRTVLMMTVAFNVLLVEVRPMPAFLGLLVAGNAGLVGGLGEMMLITYR